jgi:hypothetical protein
VDRWLPAIAWFVPSTGRRGYLSSLMLTQDLTGLDLGCMTLMAAIDRLSSSRGLAA